MLPLVPPPNCREEQSLRLALIHFVINVILCKQSYQLGIEAIRDN